MHWDEDFLPLEPENVYARPTKLRWTAALVAILPRARSEKTIGPPQTQPHQIGSVKGEWLGTWRWNRWDFCPALSIGCMIAITGSVQDLIKSSNRLQWILVRLPPHSSNSSAYSEGWIRLVKSECP